MVEMLPLAHQLHIQEGAALMDKACCGTCCRRCGPKHSRLHPSHARSSLQSFIKRAS